MKIDFSLLIAAMVALPICIETAQGQPAPVVEIGRPVVVNSPEPGRWHVFGSSVAIEGDHVLIGSSGVPAPPESGRVVRDSGVAYLFDTVGNLLCKFKKDVRVQRDNFGLSVSLSADYALIGASGDDRSGTDAGAAYLYSRDTCELLKIFEKPDPQTGDRFGASVSIAGDNVLIGAFDDSTDGAEWGGAYLFDADPDLLAPNDLKARFSNPGRDADRFSWSVSVSATHALISAPFNSFAGVHRAGAAYLYEIDSPIPALVATFRHASPDAIFGRRVALSEAGALIGAAGVNEPGGSAHLFSLTDYSEVVAPLRNPNGFVGDVFGSEVALAGRFLLLSSDNGASRTGWSVHLFDAIDGRHVHTIRDPESTFSDSESGSSGLGMRVAMSERYIVIGSPLSDAVAELGGTVYIYPLRVDP